MADTPTPDNPVVSEIVKHGDLEPTEKILHTRLHSALVDVIADWLDAAPPDTDVDHVLSSLVSIFGDHLARVLSHYPRDRQLIIMAHALRGFSEVVAKQLVIHNNEIPSETPDPDPD